MTPVWLVLPDPFSSRLFFDTGIVERLHDRLCERLELFLLDTSEQAGAWSERAGSLRTTTAAQLKPHGLGLPAKVARRTDAWLDRRIGFYPLSLRHSIRSGFNRERMQAGHQNWFLDPQLAGPLPHWRALDPLLSRWHYGRLRFVPRPLLERVARERPAIALANIQMHAVVPFIVAGRRYGLPLVGHVASWDHTVGKGIVSPHLRRYIVQNTVMRDDLVRYHGIGAQRIAVTGWPQTDVFHRRRPREEFESIVRGLGVDPARPVVLVMGNTPTNAPFESRFVERLVSWWDESGAAARFSLVFRPHPRDREWRERFAAALAKDGVGVQEPSFTDLEGLAALLQHGDAVVSNAGTILLDALVNDRPTICVLYDEGAPAGESFALKNVSGEHYRQLMESAAFYRAERFEDVVAGIDRALARPGELAEERARAAGEVVGVVDGKAAERVAEVVVSALPESGP
ncbi:MAG: CDP-glycerol glycerophosphotransferase family protein [Gaiellaceae bacterium]